MPNAMKIFMNNTFPLSTPSNVIEDFGKNLMVYVSAQQKLWVEWAEHNKQIQKIHERTQQYWDDVFEKFKLSKRDAFENLKNYHWIISPNMNSQIIYDVVKIFKSDSQHKLKEINALFNDYFFANHCANLYDLIEIWETKQRFENRIKIIRNCIDVISNMGEDFNFSDVIVPTLIAQIEGVQMSFMEENFLKVDNDGVIWINETDKLKDQHGQKIKLSEYWKSLVEKDEFLEAMNVLFMDILLQTTYPGEPYSESIHFSRNKILHGENTNYGRKVYTSRCFLILDFLSEISHNN